jgi:hypothetical protein
MMERYLLENIIFIKSRILYVFNTLKLCLDIAESFLNLSLIPELIGLIWKMIPSIFKKEEKNEKSKGI